MYIPVTTYSKATNWLGFTSEHRGVIHISADIFEVFLSRKRNRHVPTSENSFTEAPGFMGFYSKHGEQEYSWDENLFSQVNIKH